MALHELRIFRLTPGTTPQRLFQFFHSESGPCLKAALRDAGISFVGCWSTAGRNDEVVWIRGFESAEHKRAAVDRLYSSALWKQHLEPQADQLVASVEAIDMTPIRFDELLARRGRGFHELRHYRLAPGTLPKMLEFFEDVRRVVPPYGVVVHAWWTAVVDGTDRFLWLREFGDAAHKARVSKELYESSRWLTHFKPRTIGVIEERILKDLEPVPAELVGGYDDGPK